MNDLRDVPSKSAVQSELSSPAQDLDVLYRRLAEADAGIDNQTLARDTVGFEHTRYFRLARG